MGYIGFGGGAVIWGTAGEAGAAGGAGFDWRYDSAVWNRNRGDFGGIFIVTS